VPAGRSRSAAGLLRWRRAGELLAVVLVDEGQQVLAAGQRLFGIAAVRNGLPAFPVFASGACLAWR
jgi:hypothetical protein